MAVILVNWNGKADTLACLDSLRRDNYAPKRIIVVDNHSSDDSIAAIQREFPEVKVLEAGTNLGFTGGNNLGIRHALSTGAFYVCLLNNDTTLEPDAIAELVEAAEREPQAGILSPVIHYFDRPKEPWFAGSRIDLDRAEAVHENTSPPGRNDAAREIPWASGCAMLFPAGLIRDLGGFDDRFFLNWEDVDLSLRVRAAGRTILLVPSALIYHKVGRSFAATWGSGTYYYVRNQLLLVALHCGRARYRAYARILARHLRGAAKSIRGHEPRCMESVLAIVRGAMDHFAGRHGPRRNSNTPA